MLSSSVPFWLVGFVLVDELVQRVTSNIGIGSFGEEKS